MATRTWPWDSEAGDRIHGSLDVARALFGLVSNGPIRQYEDDLAVTESDPPGMSVDVQLGAGWVEGRFLEVYTAPETLPVTTADPTNPRIDLVVLRASFTDREVTLAVKAGTPAGSPAAPALQQDEDIWEEALAEVDVPATDTGITDSQITDLRVFALARSRFENVVDVVDSGSNPTTFDLALGSHQRTIINAVPRTLAVSNPIVDGRYLFEIVQPAAGGKTVTWPGNFLWPGGVAPTLSTGADKHDFFGFTYDGTSFRNIGIQLNLA